MPGSEKNNPVTFRHALAPGIEGIERGAGLRPMESGGRVIGRGSPISSSSKGVKPDAGGYGTGDTKEGTSMGIIATIVVVAVVIALALWLLRRA